MTSISFVVVFGLSSAALLVWPVSPARARLAEVVAVPDSVASDRAAGSDGSLSVFAHQRLSLAAAISVGLLVAVMQGGFGALPVGLAVAVAVWWLCRRVLRGHQGCEPADPLTLAAGWELLAAGLRAGLPVPVAVRAVAEEFTGQACQALTEVAQLLTLGADPVSAWEPALHRQETAEFARAARRTARTGSGLADVAVDLASDVRSEAGERAQARAQKASVWVALPLGLCFLPAFLCLGVLPLVAGMLDTVSAAW